MKKAVVVIVLSVLLAIGGFFLLKWIIHRLHYVSTDDARVQGNLVAVSSRVSGRIIYLGADMGDRVSKGQVLVRLDSRDFRAQLLQSEAQAQAARIDENRQKKLISVLEKEAAERVGQAQDALRSSEKSLEISRQDKVISEETATAQESRQRDSYEAAKAQVAQARASYEETLRETRRAANLYKDGAMPLQGKEQAETRQKVAYEGLVVAQRNMFQQQHLLEAAHAALRTIQIKELQEKTARNTVSTSNKSVSIAMMEEERIDVDRELLKSLAAKRKEIEAKVRYNRIMLAETTIYASVDGTVAKRIANMGEIATQGIPLFYVADSGDCWVNANIEEGQIRRVVVGAAVDIDVDAYPGRSFAGSVEFIGPVTSSELSLFPSDNPSGTFIKVAHRLPVRIRITDREKALFKPGMNVVVKIKARGPGNP